MSRLIVKNLPPSITQAQLRDHFHNTSGGKDAKLLTVTDARLAHRHDGSFRGFGFVGFKSEAEAQQAKAYFDKTFVGTSRIQVELVESSKGREGSSIRPTKRPRLEPPAPSNNATAGPSKAPASHLPSTPMDDSTVVKSKKPKKELANKEEQLAKFLALMGPKTKVRGWDNNDEDANAAAKQGVNPAASGSNSITVQDRPPLEDDGEKPPEKMSDMEWMKARMKRSDGDGGEFADGKVFEQSDDEEDAAVAEKMDVDEPTHADLSPREQELQRITEQILATGRLFLRNLTFTCTEEDLRAAFSKYGEISQVHIPLAGNTHLPKGIAYIRYTKPEDALSAYEAMDGTDLQGRLLHILPATEQADKMPAATADPSRKKTLKDSIMDTRKANAGKEFNWAMLYMNSDAVVSSVADRLQISKADILNAESGTTNPAVKLALAETHVIQETKKYLEENGIAIEAFENGATASRSDTAILVKNIPYGTTAQDLDQLFGMHGEVSRLLIPPAGTMAVVEFEHADEARKAFRGVSYKRMKNSIIYLEWAPTGLFTSPGTGRQVASGVKPVTVLEQADDDMMETTTVDPDDHIRKGGDLADTSEGSTLFVKNLNFLTTSDRLQSAFKGLSGFSFARVNTKPDPKNTDGRLSMGYGFVGFATPEDAKKAVKTMQGYILEGHALLVSFAKRGAEGEGRKEKDVLGMGTSKSAKIIVRNVPFEASKKDLKELFGAHGTLKSVRLPKKFDTKSRGFAFLEFVSRREAETAMTTLKHTHLLGRHLVLEWAKESEVVDVDELRQKIKKGYVEEGKLMPGHKRKFRVGGDANEDADGLEGEEY